MVFGRDWATSPRRFRVTVDRDVRIPLSDGAALVGDVFRPQTDEPVPVIAGFHPYNNELQTAPVRPAGFSVQRGWLESGDPFFFARRGYAHGVFNVRGTGKSTGQYQAMGPLEAQDGAAAVEWLAAQPWCTGRVGMFGVSYLAWHQIQVAMLAPPSLAAIFAPFGATDFYRADAGGQPDELTRGWLRAAQAAVDPGRSTPWLPYHRHDRREPVAPNQVRRYEIPIVPAAARLQPGQRLRVRIKAADDEPPADMVRGTAVGHVSRPNGALITIYHDEERPSALLVPVTEGNLLGTFVSGGVLSTAAETVPAAKIARQKAGPA